MDARATRTSNWPTKNRKPAAPLDDVELVTFSSDAIFRRVRQEWLRDIMRQGDAQMLALCFALSSYMGFKNDGAAWVDQHRLAAELNCDVRTIGRRIGDAVAQGWISSQRRGANTSIYRMSFSRSRRTTVELEFDNRMDDFTVESARRRLKRDASYSDRFVGTVQTDLPDLSGQVCPNNSDRFVGQSSSISSEGDPDRQSSARLGEGVQDIGEGDEQKKMDDEVIQMLGRGDMVEGRAIAGRLNPARLAFLIQTAEDDGMVAAAPHIVEARKWVSLQR